MAKCSSCSAPLAANTNKCEYCRTRNDVDLTNKYPYSVVNKQSEAICPHCENKLQTIDIGLNGNFHVDRCQNCYGLFFANGKVESLLEKSVEQVFDVNLRQLDNINQDRFSPENNNKYLKCPICQMFMSRSVFGHRSGVIVDRCRSHGIWLESGELTHLMEWKKAGGQILDIQRKNPEIAKDFDLSAFKKPIIKKPVFDNGEELNLLESVTNLLGKLLD
jgi:Zn-finger nucleic acid-binding protein